MRRYKTFDETFSSLDKRIEEFKRQNNYKKRGLIKIIDFKRLFRTLVKRLKGT